MTKKINKNEKIVIFSMWFIHGFKAHEHLHK